MGIVNPVQREYYLLCSFFASASMLHISSSNIQMSYLLSYCLYQRKTTLFFLHWFLSRHGVLHTPFAKNLRRLFCSLTHPCYCFLMQCHHILTQIMSLIRTILPRSVV